VTHASGLLVAAAVAGVAAGLYLLVRGLTAYQAGEAVRGTGTSRIESLAAGEVRLVGTIEPGPVALVSPLQSVPCVYYHSTIREERGRERVTTLHEERAVGFRLRDATGAVRVFPRGAHWDAPACFTEESGWSGDDPPGLDLNRGPGVTAAVPGTEAAIASLLTVHPPVEPEVGGIVGGGARLGVATGRRHYEERRLAPGDVVTIVGSAMPFQDLGDPAEADRDDLTLALDDPEVALNVEEARAAGLLKGSPEEAWGNAAIPGFGIGRPTRAPALDPEARPMPIATDAEAAAAAATFDIAPGELVIASVPDNPLVVRSGNPDSAVARDQGALVRGLAGAALAIASALVLALAAQGTLG
jgi:hypothetical protein